MLEAKILASSIDYDAFNAIYPCAHACLRPRAAFRFLRLLTNWQVRTPPAEWKAASKYPTRFFNIIDESVGAKREPTKIDPAIEPITI